MKRILATVLALAVVLTVTFSSTIAYLTDTESAINVAMLGNVDIIQEEYQRDEGVEHTATAEEGDLIPFVQAQKLYPAVGLSDDAYTAEPTDLFYWGPYVTAEGAGNGLWDDNNLKGAMDKMVFVENIGETDCYYRTWLAFECPVGLEYSAGPDKEFMMNVNGHELFTWENVGYAEIGGTRYYIMCATYEAILKSGETSRPSLLQVVMTGNATNEDMLLMGDTYEILAFSQAVQAENFKDATEEQLNAAGVDSNAELALNAAFGSVITKDDSGNEVANHPWVGENVPTTNVSVNSEADLLAALEAGNSVILTNDVTLTRKLTVDEGKKFTIDLNGHDLTTAEVDNNYGVVVKGDLTINGSGNVEVKGKYGFGTSTTGGNITINGGNYTHTGTYMFGCFGGSITINDGSFAGNYCVLNNFDGYTGKGIVNGGVFSISNTENKSSAAVFLGNVVDNRNIVATPAALAAALEDGGNVILNEDIDMGSTNVLSIPEDADTVLDLNNKKLRSDAPKSAGPVIKNNGETSVSNGTVTSGAVNGGSAITNAGTLDVDNVTLNGAPQEGESWPSYTVNNSGVMNVRDTHITSVHGAISSYGEGAVVTLDNVTVDMKGIPEFTSHGLYTYDGGKIIVNSGYYANNATDQADTGASVINGNVVVNGGTFVGRIESYYGTPQINGGTFDNDPSKYVDQENYTITQDEIDGKTWYTVSKKA